MMNKNAINVKNLCVDYGHKLILENVSFDCKYGEIIALLGNNGEGKSTLFKVISSLISPKRYDQFLVNGRRPMDRNKDFFDNFFFVPDSFDFPNVSVKNLFKIYGEFYSKFNKDFFLSTIDSFNIPFNKKIPRLSFGQKKKVMFSFALSTNAKVILFDEIINGFDVESKMQFRNILKSSQDGNRLFVVSSHQVRDIEDIVDGYLFLKNREILLQSSKQEILNSFECLSFDPNQKYLFKKQILGEDIMLVQKNNDLTNSMKFDMEFFYTCLHENPKKIKDVLCP